MSCNRIEGIDYIPIRLIFAGAAQAVRDVRLELDAPDAQGNFTGRFRDLATGALIDRLVNGRCERVDGIDQISYTREHADGETTTHYAGRVILLQGTSTVMIRGTFTRETIGSAVPLMGDHETEKPT